MAFMATGKLSRILGIGLSSASAAIVLAIGGAVSMALGFFGAGSVFWSIAATSFSERIVGFAVAKQAMQAAVMPVDKRLAESARHPAVGEVGGHGRREGRGCEQRSPGHHRAGEHGYQQQTNEGERIRARRPGADHQRPLYPERGRRARCG